LKNFDIPSIGLIMKTVLTCAQPTSILHLGNYLGAVKEWLKFQDTHRCFFGIVNMHAITVPQDPNVLHENTLSLAAQYLACGLDPKKCYLFVQSHVKGHTELAWVLGCLTSIGQLQRMTQFKDKSSKQESTGFIGSGLLFYPVLQAADILLYKADTVPVGEDQKQHLELTRDLAERFNGTYGPLFPVPEPAIPTHTGRIMSLQDPSKKMSKSDSDLRATLFLLDEPSLLRKKVMSAVTDLAKEICMRDDKPGISNLLRILNALTGTPLSDLENNFLGSGYGDFKKAVAEAVIDTFEPIQTRYKELMNHRDHLQSILKQGADKAQEVADKTLAEVYERVGFAKR
jgi:tryptophanyl-tRNA synthetase